MCGIAGIWHRDGANVERGVVESMTDAIAHRGPDGSGIHVRGSIGLGHRRLKIIDLSSASAQPMWLPDQSLCIVYNGEIHNYLEIGAELRSEGVSLRTSSDTEVMLWAYRLWGLECFERFNGMWAAALWHRTQSRLVLARDRFGIKPLVYSVRGPRVAFASEPKALLAAFPEERRANWQMVRDFVCGAVPDADDHTFFENVHSVNPGETLTFEPERQHRRRYWTFEPGTEATRPDAAEQLRELLEDSVRLRLRSDVPVGVALSGGLDSSAVARIAAGVLSSPLSCFSLRYEDNPALDESHYAAMVADDPSRYHMHWITPGPQQLLTTTAAIVWHHDAPTPIRGRYPQWHVLQEAAKHVTVVLDGQGADELLGGYPRFVLPFALDRLNPRLAQARPRQHLLHELIQLGRTSTGAHRLLPRLILGALTASAQRNRKSRMLANRDADSRGTVSTNAAPPALHRFIGEWAEPQERPYRSRLNNSLWAELKHAGLPEILHAEDAISMAFSLESRLPFLDHRIVELCFSLPFDAKIGAGWTKLLLREAMTNTLPAPVLWRRRKLGFPGDYASLLGGPQGLTVVRDLLLDTRTLERGCLDRAWLLQTLGRSESSARHWVRTHLLETWSLITLELWHRLFLDDDRSLVRCPVPSAA